MICQAEAPIQTQATAQKRPETPMGITGLSEQKEFLTQLTVMFTLYSAKTPRKDQITKIGVYPFLLWIFRVGSR